jgi:hypothetical protein
LFGSALLALIETDSLDGIVNGATDNFAVLLHRVPAARKHVTSTKRLVANIGRLCCDSLGIERIDHLVEMAPSPGDVADVAPNAFLVLCVENRDLPGTCIGQASGRYALCEPEAVRVGRGRNERSEAY